MNVGGKSLSVYEIMVAKTFDYQMNFDLSEKVDALFEKLGEINYDTINKSTVLQVVSAILNMKCSKKDILNIDKVKFINIWDDVDDAIQRTEDIQGLVAAEVIRGAVYIRLAESAPHNLGKRKKFEGVGGHLFAIAIKLSNAMGFNGYVFFDAKNMKLLTHYTDKFGASRIMARIHVYRMEIDEFNAQKLLEKYTLEGDLNAR